MAICRGGGWGGGRGESSAKRMRELARIDGEEISRGIGNLKEGTGESNNNEDKAMEW